MQSDINLGEVALLTNQTLFLQSGKPTTKNLSINTIYDYSPGQNLCSNELTAIVMQFHQGCNIVVLLPNDHCIHKSVYIE